MSTVRATPFHARAADANPGNRWTARAGFTVAAEYSGVGEEAAAARFGVAMADISWRWRVMLEGPRVLELAQRLFTRDVAALKPGEAMKALWLTDGGGVRGAGVVARHGKETLQLVAAAEDRSWIGDAAALFGVSVRDTTESEGGLALVGPYAATLIATLGLDPALEPLAFRKVFWRGLDITVSRFGEHGGYELWCGADDALYLWDRVTRAGEAFALLPAGLDAMDVLDLEAGVPRPERDYDGARAGTAAEPLAGELRLASLIDAAATGFNGEAAARAAKPRRTLVGLLLDTERPAPFAPLLRNGTVVGQTLSSRPSPALRCAIALAQVDAQFATPGAILSLTLPGARGQAPVKATGQIVELPFLPPPEPVTP
jgi:aminomethyltransferase